MKIKHFVPFIFFIVSWEVKTLQLSPKDVAKDPWTGKPVYTNPSEVFELKEIITTKSAQFATQKEVSNFLATQPLATASSAGQTAIQNVVVTEIPDPTPSPTPDPGGQGLPQ